MAAHKKQMPFVAGRGVWPSALSRARGFRVYRSEAETLDQKKRADQAQGLARKGKIQTMSRPRLQNCSDITGPAKRVWRATPKDEGCLNRHTWTEGLLGRTTIEV